jgi:arylsulfatase A-like enzyme
MKKFLHALLAPVLLPYLALGSSPDRPDHPNILLVISDDQGFSDFGFNGNPVVKTPVLDRLAAESAVLKNFVVSPACSPTRAALLTGRDPLRSGVWGVPPRANLRPDEKLMPAYFLNSGYRTFYAGKGDIARTALFNPWDLGWEDSWTISGYQQQNPKLTTRQGLVNREGWTMDILTDLSIEFIEKNRDRPWFVTLAPIIPHLPWECPEEYSDPFLKKGLSSDLAECYGSIAHMDHSLGRVLEAIKATAQSDRTIVVFLSDNGMSNQNNSKENISKDDWAKRNMHGLRGAKATVWENGIISPLLVSWPGRIPASPRAQFGAVEDVLPTLLSLAGVKPFQAPLPLDGVDLSPALLDPAAPVGRPAVFRMAVSHEGSPRVKNGIVPDPEKLSFEDHHLTLRDGRYKLHSLPGGECLLFDISADPKEANDLFKAHPEITAAMLAETRSRWERILAKGRAFGMPVVRLSDRGRTNVPGFAAQRLSGRAHVVGATTRGLGTSGDSVAYRVQAAQPGHYALEVRGSNLEGDWILSIGDQTLVPESKTGSLLKFPRIDLPAGVVELTLTLSSDSAEEGIIDQLAFLHL